MALGHMDPPQKFDSDGDGFSHVIGPAVVETTRDIHAVANDLELTFPVSPAAALPSCASTS
jgi:hypothetical protein